MSTWIVVEEDGVISDSDDEEDDDDGDGLDSGKGVRSEARAAEKFGRRRVIVDRNAGTATTPGKAAASTTAGIIALGKGESSSRDENNATATIVIVVLISGGIETTMWLPSSAERVVLVLVGAPSPMPSPLSSPSSLPFW